jgi:hypothetical protein
MLIECSPTQLGERGKGVRSKDPISIKLRDIKVTCVRPELKISAKS